jgi:PPOX class probable F420-dependent enzyme
MRAVAMRKRLLDDDHRPDEDNRSAAIPATHLDLVECPRVAALSTVTPDGYPQTTVVWCDFDGECLRVNTMRGFAKERNMRRNPRVALLCYDPSRTVRYLEVRGRVVEMTETGGTEHLDGLASKYAGRSVRFFGDSVQARFEETEVPVLCRIKPTHVTALDATEAKI